MEKHRNYVPMGNIIKHNKDMAQGCYKNEINFSLGSVRHLKKIQTISKLTEYLQ